MGKLWKWLVFGSDPVIPVEPLEYTVFRKLQLEITQEHSVPKIPLLIKRITDGFPKPHTDITKVYITDLTAVLGAKINKIRNERSSIMLDNLSNCCSAPIIENTDLCSNCKEHCQKDT